MSKSLETIFGMNLRGSQPKFAARMDLNGCKGKAISASDVESTHATELSVDSLGFLATWSLLC